MDGWMSVIVRFEKRVNRNGSCFLHFATCTDADEKEMVYISLKVSNTAIGFTRGGGRR